MATAYTPGLTVTSRLTHRVRRQLPIRGEVRVEVGARVDAQDIVAETFMPGDVTPLNIANLLSLPPADVPECMLMKEGDTVRVGEPLAQTKGIFGLLKNTCVSKHEGTIETISGVTGQVILRGAPIPATPSTCVSSTPWRGLGIWPRGCMWSTRLGRPIIRWSRTLTPLFPSTRR